MIHALLIKLAAFVVVAAMHLPAGTLTARIVCHTHRVAAPACQTTVDFRRKR